MRQFKEYTTFFDLGIDDNEKNFRTLYCVMPETIKKRGNITKLALRYLLGDNTLSVEEIAIAKSILDDSYYNKPKKYNHCKICSDNFSRIVLTDYSKDFKYWEICFPTVPYFPGNMMLYLKDRKLSKLENVQDLNKDQLEELKYIMKNMQQILNESVFDGELLGINILFNQISKSQLCIHGHIELMIKDVDKKDLGFQLLDKRNFDCSVNTINKIFKDNEIILKTKEGIRIDMDKVSDEKALEYLGVYEKEIEKIITLGNYLREGKLEISTGLDLSLYNGLSPAPTNSVYLTYYRKHLYLSSVPEIIPPTIYLNQVGDLSDEENMYLIKCNATTPNAQYRIMKKYSPVVRPSSKVSYQMPYGENIKRLTKKIGKALGTSI